MASLFTVMFVAVMCYVILMLFKYLNKKKDGQEKSSMIKNVVFDVGLVLVEFNWQDYLDSFGFDEEKRERIAKATFQSRSGMKETEVSMMRRHMYVSVRNWHQSMPKTLRQ